MDKECRRSYPNPCCGSGDTDGDQAPRLHMWTASSSQGVSQCFDQIACVHMSGLSVRSHMSAGQDGFRDTGSKRRWCAEEVAWPDELGYPGTMPFKHNAARRHRIPKPRHRIRNWPAYEGRAGAPR